MRTDARSGEDHIQALAPPWSRCWLGYVVALGLAVAGLTGGSPAWAKADLSGPVKWRSWDVGLKQAASTKKNILLLLHTDSCPKCAMLAESFRTNRELQKLAKNLVMVEVNGGTAPLAVVQRFARYGNYYPRVLFLQPNGTPMEEIVSANPKFPYYFQPSKPEILLGAMRKAIATRTASTAKIAAHKDKG